MADAFEARERRLLLWLLALAVLQLLLLLTNPSSWPLALPLNLALLAAWDEL